MTGFRSDRREAAIFGALAALRDPPPGIAPVDARRSESPEDVGCGCRRRLPVNLTGWDALAACQARRCRRRPGAVFVDHAQDARDGLRAFDLSR